jgi:chaperonin GroES
MTTNELNTPNPVGWRILIKIKAAQEKTTGGIILTPQSQDTARVAAQIGQVVTMGKEAYSDLDRFNDNWCAEGDWVMIGKFAGVRFEVNGEEYRIINDDEVIATVTDPDLIKYYG